MNNEQRKEFEVPDRILKSEPEMTNLLQPQPIAYLKVDPKDLKMLREFLCKAQNYMSTTNYISYSELLIKQIDKHRPLGYDGKHGELHTETCGCEDK